MMMMMMMMCVCQRHNALLYNQLPCLRGEGDGPAIQQPPAIISLHSEPVCNNTSWCTALCSSNPC